MRTRILLGLWCGLSAIACFTPGMPAQAGSFRLLFESAWSPSSYAVAAVSTDGSTAVGEWRGSGGDVSFSESWRWTAEDGVHSLGHLNGGPVAGVGAAYAVSADGSVVAGLSDRSWAEGEAYRWTQSEGMVSLGPETLLAEGISADGSVIVGMTRWYGSSGLQAFRWTESERVIGLGYLGINPSPPFAPPPEPVSKARAVSADGSVVVGESSSETGTQAFRWTTERGMVGLGYLEGYLTSQARDVSADGLTIVGRSGWELSASQAFLWTESARMVGLGHLSGHEWSQAYAVSADGSLVVGSSAPISGEGSQNTVGAHEAFIWDAAHGMRNLRDVLVQEYGLDVPIDSLGRAVDISADGRVIVGNAPEGPWIAVIPEPSTMALALAGLLGLLLYVWRKRRHAA